MGSRSARRKARRKRQRRVVPTAPVFDLHAQVIVESLAEMEKLLDSVAAFDDHVAALDDAFDQALSRFVEKSRGLDAVGLVEAARVALLPITFDNQIPVAAGAGAAQVELLALIALAGQREETANNDTDADAAPVNAQEMNEFVSEAKEELDRLLHFALLRSILARLLQSQLSAAEVLVTAR